MKTIFAILILILPQVAHAAAYTEDQAVRVIVGEASDQGLKGMTMVAETIRRRHSIRGCYGINAAHNAKEPAWVWAMARAAWKQSATTQLTNNATGWGSIKDFQNKRWAKGKKIVCRYRGQIFYKEAA